MFSNRRLPPSEARRLQRHRAPRSPCSERKLSPEDAGFAQLGEGESFRLPDGGFKFFSRESRAESQVVLATQVEELNREFIRGQKQRQTKIARTNVEFEMVADDPRVYVAIKEPTDARFPRTPFVLTNSGGDVAHRVKLEMPWKLKGRNVSFAMVETIPAGENRESLPTIGEEGLTSKT